jgi:hypothetical protein
MPAPSSAGGRGGRRATILHEPERAGCAAWPLHLSASCTCGAASSATLGRSCRHGAAARDDLHERFTLADRRAFAGQENTNELVVPFGHHPSLRAGV